MIEKLNGDTVDTDTITGDVFQEEEELMDEPTDYSPMEVAELAGVRAQMVYNYMKSGRIPHFVNDSGKKRIKASDAQIWIDEYKANKVKREKRRADQLEAELRGEADNK